MPGGPRFAHLNLRIQSDHETGRWLVRWCDGWVWRLLGPPEMGGTRALKQVSG
ncbi:hypothetical protein BZL30_8227 [Mycobacterium kansasii]|uniref:Uncharacterized protein n=1 Tax=Mycobacterium kansasii TaxID=1768 RepID=A0A1V3WHB6_MYCKA|nr:hypothetical protein BZL30_8227 [Mycobacterium kansasii]